MNKPPKPAGMRAARLVQPARQPVCCSCRKADLVHTADFTFACAKCRLYRGYCGPNGCDCGDAHTCWSENMAKPTFKTPDYFGTAAYQRHSASLGAYC